LTSNFKNRLLNINYASTTWVRLEKEKNTYISNSIAKEKKAGSLSDPAIDDIFAGFSANTPHPELDLNKVPKLHMVYHGLFGRNKLDI